MVNQHPEISKEERMQLAIETYAYLFGYTINSLADRFGSEETTRIMKPIMYHLGAGGAVVNKERLMLKGPDVESIAECMEFIMDCMQVKVHIHKTEQDSIIWIVDRCPFENFSMEVCLAFDMLLDGMVQTQNPDFECHHTSMVNKGDRFCSFAVERKNRGKLLL
jgi:predicted hydrocarbon binding protein